jgi:hypothetical protein
MVLALVGSDGSASQDDLFTFLFLAPLLPVLGVALAYGPESDPAHEMALATPTRGLRLLALRSVVVLSVATFWLAVAALLSSGSGPIAFGWLLPAIGLTSTTVGLMGFLAPRRAATAVAIVWVIGVVSVRLASEDRLAAFGATGQVTMAILAAAAAAAAVAMRDRFDRLEPVR